jgi:hypothetical protein
MSYEYRLVFDDGDSAQHAIDALRLSDACVRSHAQDVYLKDQGLNTLAEYDVRLMREGDQSLWLEINFRSINLYNLVQEALSSAVFRCFEDGDWDDETTLKEAFRIKGDT